MSTPSTEYYTLSDENIERLNAKFEVMENNRLFERLTFAIQDINSADQLESKFPYLRRLHNNLTYNGLQYISDEDTGAVQGYKRMLLRNQLLAAKQVSYIERKFSLQYSPSCLTDIIRYLEDYTAFETIQDDDKARADDWWE